VDLGLLGSRKEKSSVLATPVTGVSMIESTPESLGAVIRGKKEALKTHETGGEKYWSRELRIETV